MQLKPVLAVDDLNRFLETDFPEVNTDGKIFTVEAIGPGFATMRFDPLQRHLRPGNTISGPSLFALADVTAYVALLAHIGPMALAVTTSLNINFLRKPPLGPLLCTCNILKLGKRLAVLDASISGVGSDELVAHATATYSIPPK
ncbi:PaaI family thioesterase [Rhizobium sp. 32-5/1]|uniref:PaaI family thioesterase n=1 Tax=Rhizobium sp. 32-5/1 TaxID=3019602 RepID=UPI00240DE5C9|nr:PaaI family thioesterase [Rhizobium sp. 32-5/1]WEZ83815.1 PaaI family thioesterase [Rhizobium sp. 32-5/1]